jgi:hypothetical protein
MADDMEGGGGGDNPSFGKINFIALRCIFLNNCKIYSPDIYLHGYLCVSLIYWFSFHVSDLWSRKIIKYFSIENVNKLIFEIKSHKEFVYKYNVMKSQHGLPWMEVILSEELIVHF